jgi:hypothetical protein
VFGLTFGIQGSLTNPQVLVNPLSMFAPGLFRGLFEMTAENPRVIAREDRARAAEPSPPRARPSRRETLEGASGTRAPASPEVLGGWSSETSRPQRPEKRK